jgi:tetratricopeptide (TPR) repeat protein
MPRLARLVRVSPRTRIRLIVGVAALAAVGIAVGATLMGKGEDEPPAAQPEQRGAPGLELSVLLRNDREAKALRAAERTYDRGNRADAKEQFDSLLASDPESVEAAVGVAVSGWPEQTLGRLRRLAVEHPKSALVHLHLGLALYASGQDTAAEDEWRQALEVEPDTASALRAEDLLHPDMAPGRPFFYPSFAPTLDIGEESAKEQLAALRRQAATGDVRDNLLYGVALQRVGRSVSARAAFARALELDGDSLAARVADAVGRFEKDKPAEAFSRLGPLAQANPRSAIVRFHLGLLLLWIRDVEGARKQLQNAAAADRRGFYGKEARALLSRLEVIGT